MLEYGRFRLLGIMADRGCGLQMQGHQRVIDQCALVERAHV
jgi:hypothetical protein